MKFEDIKIHFVSGMPRAGNTILLNLLAQNPEFHPTPTNDLAFYIANIGRGWKNNVGFKAQGLWKNILPRIRNALSGFIYGFYKNEIDDGKIIFDKSVGGGWLPQIGIVNDIFGHNKCKFLVPIRHPMEVAASFEKLHNKNPMTEFVQGDDWDVQEGRIRHLFEQGVIGRSIRAIREAKISPYQDQIIFIKFNELTGNPVSTIENIHNRINEPMFQYDPKNVEQKIVEDDSFHGWELHKIRKEIKSVVPDYNHVLSESILKYIKEVCSDIICMVEN